MIDVLLVGAGHRGRSRFRAWDDAGGRIVAVVETGQAARNALFEQGVVVFDSLGAALEATPSAQVVDICTAPDSHKDLTVEALAAGRTVLCEKPFVRNMDEAEEVRKAAAMSPGSVVVMHSYLGEPTIRALRRRVAKGSLGEIIDVQCTWLEAYSRDTQGIQDPDHWVHRLGGGRIEETLPHILYTLFDLLGDTALEIVSTTFSKRTPYPWVVADTAAIVLKGAKGTARIFISFGVTHDHFTFSVAGSKGHIEACLDTRIVERVGLKWNDRDKRDPVERMTRHLDGIGRRAIEAGKLVDRTLRRPRKRDWIILALVQSLERGGPLPVTLDEAIATVRLTREICDRIPSSVT